MRSIYRRLLVFGFLLLAPGVLEAYPSSERDPTTLSQPPLDLVTSQASSMIMEGDRYLWLAFGSTLKRIDTQTWALTSDQVPALTGDLSGDITGLAVRSGFLYAAQSDGDVIRVDLGDVTATPTSLNILDNIALGPLAADTESGSDDDKLYLIDQTNRALLIYDIGSASTTSIPLRDSLNQTVTTTSLVWVPFPTTNATSTTDKVFVASNDGLVFEVDEGSTTVTKLITLSATDKNLPAVARSPDGSFLFVLDSSDSTIHVIDTSTGSEVDADSSSSGTNPIAVTGNTSLSRLLVLDVLDPDDVYAYVSGSSGLSVVDLNYTTTFSGTSLLSTIELDSPPGITVATSDTDGYVISSNSNATLSVISDNPFVTVASTSLTGSLGTSGSFTVTFQSDEAGSYRVRVGGDGAESGTSVDSGTVASVDTDVTSATISYNASTFTEGTNRIFVFVEDSSGNVGRDAIDITVDTPPPSLEVTEATFGNGRIYVDFDRLSVSDIDHYAVYVDTDQTVVATKSTQSGSVSQPSSGGTVTVEISDLTNGTIYYVGIEAVDASGNHGTRTTTFGDGSRIQITPEETVGLASRSGETGCTLVRGLDRHAGSPLGLTRFGQAGLALWFVLMALIRCRFCRNILPIILLLGQIALGLTATNVSAEELSPQWFSMEFKGGTWIPTGGVTKDFLGCCQPFGLIDFGFLYHSRWGFEVGAGLSDSSGRAVGSGSGAVSGDRFNLLLIPFENNFTFRGDFKENQLVVPYAKVGGDYIFFRENTQGQVVKGLKYGLHGTLGVQFLLEWLEDLALSMEKDAGINDVYFVIEGRYGWVNNFGGGGLNLSGLTVSGGLLFEF